MLEEDSEIIDFYPSEFAIDMNGKKMEWQGVALLPFIDEKRLLTAINRLYPELSEEELRRNAFGDHTLFVSEQHPLYDHICVLYGKRKSVEPMQLDTKLSGGISGTVKPDPACLPGTTFSSPLSKVGEPDITSDRSISSLYEFPEQTTPHRSVLLKGLRPPAKVLTNEDREWTRAGAPDRGRGRGRGRGGRGGGGGGGGMPSHGSMRFGNGPVNAAQNQHTRWGSNPSSPYGTPTGYDSPCESAPQPGAPRGHH
jgi:5'-3' exoribonuclease 2